MQTLAPSLEPVEYEFSAADVIDLSNEEQADQISYLRESAHQPDAQRSVAILRNGFRGMMEQVMALTHGMYDIDDTLTPSGVPSLPEEVVHLLRQQRQMGMHNGALTGRHEALIKPLYDNHDGDPGLDPVLAELGAFKFSRNGKREYHLSNEKHEDELPCIRTRVSAAIQETLKNRYNVEFEPNLGGAHQSLDSHTIYHNGSELVDEQILANIIRDLNDELAHPEWEVRRSSRHTIDVVPAVITKKRAMAKWLDDEKITEERISYAEDSQNGLDVFEHYPRMMKVAVVGAKTPDKLLEHADIAVTDITSFMRFTIWAKTQR